MISDEQAIAAARQALVGKVEPQAEGPIRVSRQGARIMVEFGRHDPPGTRGPDYDARVCVDAHSGLVQSVLGGG